MNLIQALVLGAVQGVTEFLPISSSAHLILVPRFLAWPDQGLAFDVMTHGGTLLAVLTYFRADLLGIARSIAQSGGRPTTPEARLGWALALGTIPVAVVGLLAHDWIATAGRNPRAVAIPLALFGVVLWATDRWASHRRALPTLRVVDGLVIGSAQALALWPGTSRSGITLTAGRLLGFDRSSAARFSFLLSVPATGLAFAKDLWDLSQARDLPVPAAALAVGFVAAALSGYAVIAWLLKWVSRHGFLPFAIYRVALAVAILMLLAG